MDTEAMMNKLRIRRARLYDIPTLQELIPLAYRVLGAGHFSPQQIESGLVYMIGVGLAAVARHVPATGRRETARRRLGGESDPGVPSPVTPDVEP